VTALRKSCQITIAPPAPSDTISGLNWPPSALFIAAGSFKSARPSTGHAPSTSPEAST
jgi:hypothetical protein